MNEYLREIVTHTVIELASVDTQLVILVVILVAIVIVLDATSHFINKQSLEIGIEKITTPISIDGSRQLPSKTYVSDMQRLAGRPDALVSEKGNIIPVERKPLSKKIRDRHVIQLLVYMRLVEEFEGKKPPYGYLILGPNARKVKIYNTEEKQQWLQNHIDTMLSILEEDGTAQPKPHPRKCSKCHVRHVCEYRI